MKVAPGNIKALLEEWQRVHTKQDEASKNIPEFEHIDNGQGATVSGLNPSYAKARDKVYNEGAKSLYPLADELDAQQNNADSINDVNDRAKYEALKRILSLSRK